MREFARIAADLVTCVVAMMILRFLADLRTEGFAFNPGLRCYKPMPDMFSLADQPPFTDPFQITSRLASGDWGATDARF